MLCIYFCSSLSDPTYAYILKVTYTNVISVMRVRMCVLVAQSCPTLCATMDCSSPGSSILGVLQARIREWVDSLLQG